MKICHIVRLEWYCSIQHRIEHNPCTPQVSTKAPVTFVSENFGCNIGWCSTLFLDELMLLDDLGHSEITQFNSFLIIEQDVIQLDVSVKHASAVAMTQTIDDLLEDEPGLLLSQTSLPLDVVQ